MPEAPLSKNGGHEIDVSSQGSPSKGERRGRRGARCWVMEGANLSRVANGPSREEADHLESWRRVSRRVHVRVEKACSGQPERRRGHRRPQLNKRSRALQKTSQPNGTGSRKQPRTFPRITTSRRRRIDPFFVLKPIEKMARCPRRQRRSNQQEGVATRPFSGRHSSVTPLSWWKDDEMAETNGMSTASTRVWKALG